MTKIEIVLMLFVIIILAIVYVPWLTLSPLSAGDWPYIFLEQVKAFSFFPEIRFLWLAPYYQVVTKIVVQYVGVPWEIAEKMLWYFPFIAVSCAASYRVFRSWISVLVYSTNTYILMIVGGGQMGIAMAYAFAPLAFDRFLHIAQYSIHRINLKYLIVSALFISIQVMFDPRISLLTAGAAIIALMYSHLNIFSRRHILNICVSLATVFSIILILHAYWIIPMIISHGAVIEKQLSEVTSAALRFLSFATFSQTISLLHPNWPDNVFGKVSFMQPEFLLVPIIGFSVLLLGEKKAKQMARPYALLAIIGAFLAKGSQDPLGGVYVWMFNHIPGFWLFRDATKFYLLIALAYAYLIPQSLSALQLSLTPTVGRAAKAVPLVGIVVWAILIRQSLARTLSGTFTPHTIDREYVIFEKTMLQKPAGTSSYWVPQVQRFGYSDSGHPAYSASSDVGETASLSAVLNYVRSAEFEKQLVAKHVGLVVVPYDTNGELFLTDRTYDDSLYQRTVEAINDVSELSALPTFTKVRVWMVNAAK